MTDTSGRRKAKTSKPSANPTPQHDLLGQATALQNILNSQDMRDANRIVAMKEEIDIPKLERAIARYRRAIALQSRILDELEAEVKEIKRDARKTKPAKSKKRPTHRKT